MGSAMVFGDGMGSVVQCSLRWEGLCNAIKLGDGMKFGMGWGVLCHGAWVG